MRRYSPAVMLSFLVAALGAFLLCVRPHTNPNDPDYQGDYRLSIDWTAFEIIPGSLEVLKPYRLAFTTGTDGYRDISVNVAVDTARLRRSFQDGDSLTIVLLAPFQGDVIVRGVRPNDREEAVDADTLEGILVVNPYVIEGPSSVGRGESVMYRVRRIDGKATSGGLEVVWDESRTLSLGASYVVETDKPIQVRARIVDAFGNAVVLAPANLTIAGVRPAVQAWALPDTVRQGDTISASVTAGPVDVKKFAVRLVAGSKLLTDTLVYYSTGTGARTAPALGPVTDTGRVIFRIAVKDSISGLWSVEQEQERRILYTLLAITFPDSTRIIPAARPYVLTASGQASAYRWTIAGKDTTTDSAQITLTLAAGQADTVTVRGINRWGYAGPTAKIVLTARVFAYSLSIDTIPQLLQARRWAKIVVSMRDADDRVVTGAGYQWSFTPQPDSQKPGTGRYEVFFRDSTGGSVTVKIRGTQGADSTEQIVRNLVIRRFSPSIAFTQDTIPANINQPVMISLTATDPNPDGGIAEVRYRLNSQAAVNVGTATTWPVTPGTTGKDTISAWCMDNDGFESNRAVAYVVVTAGKPWFVRVKIDTSVYVRDSITLMVEANPGAQGAHIEKYVFRQGGQIRQADSSGSFRTIFGTPGYDTIRVSAISDIPETSAVDAAISVRVDAGRPVITRLKVDTGTTFINTAVACSISAVDGNGEIVRVEIDKDGNGTADVVIQNLRKASLDTTVTLNYASADTHTVRVRAQDEDGMWSDWAQMGPVRVSRGEPMVTGVTPDSVWINRNFPVRITAADNGTVRRFALSGDGTSFGGWRGDSLRVDTTFGTADTGWHRIWVKVKDNDSLVSAAYEDSIYVRPGRPAVTRIAVDSTIFVRDARKYSLRARDENGFVRRIHANWNGGTTPESTITIARDTSGIDTFFVYHYDATLAGQRTIRFWAEDEDSLWSGPKDTAVIVRLAPPVVWGDAGDTIWVIVDSGYDKKYPVHVNAYDTNGVNNEPVRYYFQGSGQAFDTTQADDPAIFRRNSVDTVMWTFPNLGTPNQVRQMWIAALDDDGLLRGRISGTPWVVFADSAPRAISATSDGVADGRQLSWSGMDAKDSLATEYRILIKKGGQPDTSENSPDIAKDWTRGDDSTFAYNATNLKPFSWTYVPSGGTDTYYYQIIARDARGTKSVGQYSFGNFDYTQP